MPDLWPSLAPCNGRHGRQGMNTLYTARPPAHSGACAPLVYMLVRDSMQYLTRAEVTAIRRDSSSLHGGCR